MATKKPAPKRAASKPAAPAAPEILDTVSLLPGNGPCLVGRDATDGALVYAVDDSDTLEFVVGDEVVHRGCEWLAPEHFRGADVVVRRPVAR
jgi:hypothetical protein